MPERDLQELERRTFRTVTDDGLWDVLIASTIAPFAIGPILSRTMGDLWSSAIFLPIWLAVYVAIRVVRARIVVPRVGWVRLGEDRRRRMRRFGVVMASASVVALALGILAAIGVSVGWIHLGGMGFPLAFSLVSLVGLSIAAVATNIPRFWLYGLILAIAPLVGEWLWRNEIAAHHGFPVVFGAAAVIIGTLGFARFVVLIRNRPLPPPAAVL